MSDKRSVIFAFGVEYIRFQRELKMNGNDACDLMVELITNMLYWESHWSPCKSSEEVMVEDWDVDYFEYNNLINDIFRIHQALERHFTKSGDLEWGVFGVDVLVRNDEYLDIGVRKMGDYRIEQWYLDNGSKLCPNGALRESVSGSRWNSANHRHTKKRTTSRNRSQR